MIPPGGERIWLRSGQALPVCSAWPLGRNDGEQKRNGSSTKFCVTLFATPDAVVVRLFVAEGRQKSVKVAVIENGGVGVPKKLRE